MAAAPASHLLPSLHPQSTSTLRPSASLLAPEFSSTRSFVRNPLVAANFRISPLAHNQILASGENPPSHLARIRPVFAGHDCSKRLISTQPRVVHRNQQQRDQAREGGQRPGSVDSRSLEEVTDRTSLVTAAGVMLPAHVDHLTSVANAFVKHVVKLRQSSSYRHACGSVAVVGDIPLRELCEVAIANLESHPFIECLLLVEDSKLPPVIGKFSKRVVRVTAAVMHKLSGLDSVEGLEAVGVVPLPASFLSLQQAQDHVEALSNWCPCPERLLVLDAIQDPGNLGTLLRTAAAFDWDGVFLANGCCDPFNEKALRASRGASFRIPIASGKWSQFHSFAVLREIKLYAGEPQHYTFVTPQQEHKRAIFKVQGNSKQGISLGWSGEQKQGGSPTSVHHLEDTQSLCLILGNEGQGLSKEARAVCNLISIPMQGRFESLNVAIAGGILLFTLQKIRNEAM